MLQHPEAGRPGARDTRKSRAWAGILGQRPPTAAATPPVSCDGRQLSFAVESGGAAQEAVDSALSKYAESGVDRIKAWESLGKLAKSKLDGLAGTRKFHFDVAVAGKIDL